MKRAGSIALVLSLTFLMAASMSIAADEPAAPPKILKVGDPVGKIAMTDIEGGKAEVAFDKGFYALSFFNSACSACKAELTLLDAFAKQNKNLKVVAVCVDAAGAKTAKPFVSTYKFKLFDIYINPDYTIPEMFGFSFSPSLVVIKDGKIVFTHAGYMNSDEEALAKVLLK